MDNGNINENQLSSLSLSFAESVYEEYLANPSSVPEDWRDYFEGQANGNVNGKAAVKIGPSFKPHSLFNPGSGGSVSPIPSFAPATDDARVSEVATAVLQDRVDQLIRAYRIRGHMVARLDPLGIPRPPQVELDPYYHGLTDADMDRVFSTNTISGPKMLTLKDILLRLRNTYCRSIGVQFMHIDNYEVKMWLQERMESTQNRLKLTQEEQIRILTRLTDASIFEEFIQKKFIGAKSFSLEGAESLIPLLDLAIERAGEQQVNEIVIGMAHRGRLNVLANIMNKSPRQIFREFEDMDPEFSTGRGDVKYHLGYHNDWQTVSGKEIHLALCFNPSHLEFVNPVAMGRVRAKQDRLSDTSREKYISIIIHGDASFAGEGIVQETLNLSRLDGYTVGGTVHVIVNNQIGFTTDPGDARSGIYATDIAKMLQVPIFHVNGEDPEAVAQVVKLSMDFRQAFNQDIFIDMYCYRKRGHNESDEPSFTQPTLYSEIARRKPVREGYLENLITLGGITPQQAEEISNHRRQMLEEDLAEVHQAEEHTVSIHHPSILGRVWKNYLGGPENGVREVKTGVERDRLQHLLELQCRLPNDFTPHPKIEQLLNQKRLMATGEAPLNWAAAETLALATVATEGARVRFSGQDSQRGTFSHRHAMLHDCKNGKTYMPLQHLTADQAPVEIINSPLSEAGVLGFEYGYSVAYPDGLVMWEAQFGDFWNAAQVIVDQFIVSAEDKWRSLSGLVLLLPHGFEGMGPEHSSARLERVLSLAAEDNIQVIVPSTPAQIFHALRRQVVRPWRKPLIVMTPKSLLRHPAVVSPLEDFETGTFRRILPDPECHKGKRAKRVLLCSGKIYYELDKWRKELDRDDLAILRVEQLYPLPENCLEEALSGYPDGTPVFWVQEEPENMGAWRHFRVTFGDSLLGRYPLSCISRLASASPATGSANAHKVEQQAILERALDSIFETAQPEPANKKIGLIQRD